MSKRYTGGVVSSAVPTVNAASASGIFTLGQQATAQSNNNWPPFKVEKSLRFRKSVNAYLSRTLNSTSTTYTVSAWVKRGLLSGYQYIFASGPNSASDDKGVAFDTSTNQIYAFNSSTQGLSTAVFRDPAAWYHVVMSVNSGTATVYVNNVNTGISHTSMALGTNGRIGRFNDSSSANDFDGYMSEVYLIDGQALTPSSFGATDKDGNWSPIAYTGTYGQNGFYLNFKDATSTTTLGYDYSGNGNNWTPNNLSVTAGTTYDSMIDVPSDQSDGTANNRGNYCTINPLLDLQTQATYSEGNLKLTTSPSGGFTMRMLAKGTMQIPSTGKWYFTMTGNTNMNLTNDTGNRAQYGTAISDTQVRYTSGGTVLLNGNEYATVASFSATDEVGMAIDMDASTVAIYKNGALQNTVFSAITSGFTYYPMLLPDSSSTAAVGTFNFGQRPFTYAPPSGFKTLNTFNLPEPTIKQPNKYFDAKLWTGDATTPKQVVTGLAFQPDFIWTKARTIATQHALYDAVRGVGSGKILLTDTTDAEGGTGGTSDATYGYMSAINSDGFTTTKGSSATNYFFNNSGQTYVAWNWNAGGSTVTNTTGTITSQVRANPTAGFSIVTWTGTGSTATVGHGLGATPAMIIVKRRNAGSSGWSVYFTTLSAGYILSLQSTNGQASSPARFTTTLPTSSVFSIGTDSDLNASGGTYVAYCFAEIAGYSKFGSYIGNGSADGTFIYTGFRPKFILYKQSSASGEYWHLQDSSRSPTNGIVLDLYPNLSNAEYTYSPAMADFLSNGFKFRTDNSAWNGSGATYIYAAFAEAPFKYSRAR